MCTRMRRREDGDPGSEECTRRSRAADERDEWPAHLARVGSSSGSRPTAATGVASGTRADSGVAGIDRRSRGGFVMIHNLCEAAMVRNLLEAECNTRARSG